MKSLKLRLKKKITRFVELWEYKIFKFAIIINFLYLIISIVISFIDKNSDFLVYYSVGKIFLENINEIYNPLNYPPNLPFRYFPFSALFFVPYSLLELKIASILFNIFNLFLNLIISIILYKILLIIRNKTEEKGEDADLIKYICLFLIGFPQISNYVLGQINLYVCLLVLLSLLIFLKYSSLKWEFIGSIVLGISVIIKPIALLMIPFLIAIHFNLKTKKISFEFKKNIIRFSGMILPLIINIIPFLIYPSLFKAFISINFTSEYTVTINFSISLTKIITNIFVFHHLHFIQSIIFIAVLSIFGGMALVLNIFKENEQKSIIISFVYGILLMFIAYYDTWDHHILILTPLLIILIFYLPHKSKTSSKYIMTGFYGLNFFNLIFIGIWCIIMLIFPYNFIGTIFLVLLFFTISKYCLKERYFIEGG